MASSKTRRKAEEHGVRDGAKRIERHDAALWWLHSELSKEGLMKTWESVTLWFPNPT